MTSTVVRWGGTRDDPHAQARAARSAPLLLDSPTLFREVIAAVLDAVPRAGDRGRRCRRTVVEVGVGSAATGAMYLELGADRVYSVEPSPTDALRRELSGRAGVHLVERPAPAALADLPVADMYVLDGDHNHATVHDELSWILRNVPDAVVLVHHVLWPWGRRDRYRQPSGVDAERRHRCSADGPSIADDGLSPAGLVGAGAYRVADHAGGERNGVLTAVEDCLAGAGEPWSLDIVPAVSGLGVLVRDASPASRVIRARIAPWTGSRLLADLEGNRLALHSRVLELQQIAVRAGREVAGLRAELAILRDNASGGPRPAARAEAPAGPRSAARADRAADPSAAPGACAASDAGRGARLDATTRQALDAGAGRGSAARPGAAAGREPAGSSTAGAGRAGVAGSACGEPTAPPGPRRPGTLPVVAPGPVPERPPSTAGTSGPAPLFDPTFPARTGPDPGSGEPGRSDAEPRPVDDAGRPGSALRRSLRLLRRGTAPDHAGTPQDRCEPVG